MSTLFECITLKSPGKTFSPCKHLMFVTLVNILLSKLWNHHLCQLCCEKSSAIKYLFGYLIVCVSTLLSFYPPPPKRFSRMRSLLEAKLYVK